MGTHDFQTLKSEGDILARSSRPQRNSTFVPKTRDWRYATGVIQQDDHDDSPKSKSVWDRLDRDYQVSLNKKASGGGSSKSNSGKGRELGGKESSEAIHEQEISETAPKPLTRLPHLNSPHKPMEFQKRVWRQVKRFTPTNGALAGDEEAYEATGLVVRMRYPRKHRTLVKEILEHPASSRPPADSATVAVSPASNRIPTPSTSSPNTPATARNAETVRTPHILDSIESLYNFPLFQRVWVDETHDFNATAIRATLRPTDTVVDELGGHYGWYDSAVLIDAIFPPGVPLSAKEIHAFYPHHVRWRGVMVRLTNNDYRGGDILGMQVSQ